MKKLLGAVIVAILFAGFLGAASTSAQEIEDFSYSPYYWGVVVMQGTRGTGIQDPSNIHSADYKDEWWFNPYTGMPFCGLPDNRSENIPASERDKIMGMCDTKPDTVDGLLFTYDPYSGAAFCPWVTNSNYEPQHFSAEAPSGCVARPASINYGDYGNWKNDPNTGQCYKDPSRSDEENAQCKVKPATWSSRGGSSTGGNNNGGGSTTDPGTGDPTDPDDDDVDVRYAYNPVGGKRFCLDETDTDCDQYPDPFPQYSSWDHNPRTGKAFCQFFPNEADCEEKPDAIDGSSYTRDPVTGKVGVGMPLIPPQEFWLFDAENGMRVCTGLPTENENNCSDVNNVHGWGGSGSRGPTGNDAEEVCEEMRKNGLCNTMDCSILCPPDNPGEEKLIERVRSIMNMIYLWAGIVAVIVIIISGVYFMTSRGEADKIKTAKSALLYSVIGLIIVVSAAAITNFVISALGA